MLLTAQVRLLFVLVYGWPKKKTWQHFVNRSELKPKPVECSGAQTFRRCWRSGRLIRMFARISDISCVIGRNN